MGGPFDGDELLIGALRRVQEVFTIGNEIVALHGRNQHRNGDRLEGAGDRDVGRAPVDLAVIQRIRCSNRVRAQKGCECQDSRSSEVERAVAECSIHFCAGSVGRPYGLDDLRYDCSIVFQKLLRASCAAQDAGVHGENIRGPVIPPWNNDGVVVGVSPFSLFHQLPHEQSAVNPPVQPFRLGLAVSLDELWGVVRLPVRIVAVGRTEWIQSRVDEIRSFLVEHRRVDGSQRVRGVGRVRIYQQHAIRARQPRQAAVALGQLVRRLAEGWARFRDGLVKCRRRATAAVPP